MGHRMENHLATALQDLPPEKVQQVLDFANFLRSQYTLAAPEHGSAKVILQALEQTGPLQFAPGELDALLTEIQSLRAMDLENHA